MRKVDDLLESYMGIRDTELGENKKKREKSITIVISFDQHTGLLAIHSCICQHIEMT